MNNLIKEHKGVKIYVNHTGEFYCNTKDDKPGFQFKTNSSEKLSSLEKFIDTLNSEEVKHEVDYYEINIYRFPVVRVLQSSKRIGNKIYFKNGEEHFIKNLKLIPISLISEMPLEIKELVNTSLDMTNYNDEIISLNKKIQELRKNVSALVVNLQPLMLL